MPEYIQKKCPECGAILTIKQQPGVQGMTVKCPVCQESYPFSRMTDVSSAGGGGASGASSQRRNDPGTQYPGGIGGLGQGRPAGAAGYPGAPSGYGRTPDSTMYQTPGTAYTGNMTRSAGTLVMMQGNYRFNLRMGNNVIGRASRNSQANIQIQTPGSLRMSRQHLLVQVASDPMGNVVHKCRLCKAQCNDTFINGSKLQYGDVVILRHGMTIQLPDATLRFETGPADDGTEYSVPPVPPRPF